MRATTEWTSSAAETAPPAEIPLTVLAVRSCDAEIMGPEQLILAQAEFHRDSPVRFVIVNLSDGTPPVVALHEAARRRGLESVVVRDTTPLNAVAMVPTLRCLLNTYRPDVIHTHGSKSETLVLLAGRPRARGLIGSFYGRIAMGPLRWQVFDGASLLTLRAFDRVLANSAATARQLGRYRFPMDKVHVVPSTANPAQVPKRDAALRSAARRELGLPDTVPVAVTMARLYREKGHDYFLNAIPRIRASFPTFCWVVIGDGPTRELLEARARELGIGDALVMAGYQADGWRLVAAADVAVIPSLREGMSVSLLESALLGLPIVATIAGGNAEVVLSGETGLLVPTADTENLASATLALLADPDRAEQLGAAARRRVLSLFAPDIICRATYQHYLDVASLSGARRVTSEGNGRWHWR